MREKLKILNEQVLMTAFSSVLSERMAKADWFYDYSDDRSAWHKGHDEIAEIIDDLKSFSRLDGGLEEERKPWEKHVPGVSVPPPQFFFKPKLSNRILDGLIFNSDALAVQKILRSQQKEGRRFVVFGSDPLMPQKSGSDVFRRG